jgi:hypothetical protein
MTGTRVRILLPVLLTAALALPTRGADQKDPKSPSPAARGAAQEGSKAGVYLDPESAGPDYRVQGEYLGEFSTKDGKTAKLGAQVVALGEGNFLAVFLRGGLPGDGSDGKTRIEVPGKAHDPGGGEVVFKPADGKGYSAVHNTDAVRGQTDQGEKFVLKKVERRSPDEGAKPPAGATVLFDGTNTDAWVNGHMDGRHLLAAGTKTKKAYQDFTLHVEFIEPFKPLGRDQDRGNSGIYIQDRYEVQILDTFGRKPEFNESGSIYRQHAPSINMCYPPLRWQTYDIDFKAAKFDAGGKKTHNAVVTVRHNGVVVQDKYELKDKTGAGQKEGPTPGPIQLQGHGNPVFFRNIWVVEK